MEEEQLKSNKHSAGVVYTGDGKLLIKLNNTRTLEEDHTNDHHHRIHACQLCLKEFSSAKALGGHMRVHANDKKTEHVRFDSNRRGLYCLTCSLCDKTFPSTKALSGHMRCHPDRDWRGIQPPPPTTSDDDDQHDLIQLTTGWPVTGRRGRTATSPSEEEEDGDDDDDDEEFHIAASELLLLAQEKPIDWNSGDDSEYSAAEDIGGGVPKTTWSDQEFDSRVTKMAYSKSDDDDDAKTRVKKGQNPKFYETGDLYMEADSEKFRVRKRQKTKSTTELSSVEKYRCSTCNKCFSSHQALGGHRSSHNKFKMVTINSMDAAAADHDRDDHGPNPNSAVPHQCKICDRVFNTGQALGGHQRCHYSTGPAAAQIQSNSEPKRTLLNFDLNEFPDNDDDCGDRAFSASYNSS